MTLSMIGGHFTKNGLGANYPSRICLSIAGNGLGEQHPDTIVLFRDVTVYNDGPPDLHSHPQRRTIEFAQYWYDKLRPIWQANAHRANYFTITNELGGSSPEHIKDHIAFEANICQLAHADGLKCAVGKLAGDSPDWNTNLWEELYAPFIVSMWDKYGAIYARHVYGGNLVDSNGFPTDDPPGNPQRAIFEADHLRRLGYGGGMVLAECGIDGGYGVADYGRFRAQVLGYEAALKPYADIVIGLCFWECGQSGFEADYTKHLQQLRPYLDTSFTKWEGRENMSESTEEKIFELSQSWAFPVNEDAALQKAALADGFTPSGEEQWHTVDGTRYAMQPFYKIGDTNSKRSYFAVVGQWGDVHMFPEEDLPPEPKPPYITIPPLNQRDTRWANKLCGTGPKTIGNWGCLLTAYTMLARHWGINNGRLVDAENDYYVSKAGFSGSNLVSMAMSKVYSQVKNEGWLTRDSANMNTKTHEYLSRGIPVPARVDFNPTTAQWDQHWVLLVGTDGDDYIMNDPWTGLAGVKVSDYYNVSGNDVLECIYYYLDNSPPPPSGQTVDTLRYFVPSGQYGRKIVMRVGSGTQPMQLEKRANDVILRKGDGLWIGGIRYQDSEQWRVVNGQVQKGIDTSDAGNGGRDAYDLNWAQWIPQHVEVGKTYHSTPMVRRFDRTTCMTISSNKANDYLYIKALVPKWTSLANSSIVLNDVLIIEWRSGTPDLNVPPTETYYFAKEIGYCGWGSHFINEIADGQAPLTGKLDCGM